MYHQNENCRGKETRRRAIFSFFKILIFFFVLTQQILADNPCASKVKEPVYGYKVINSYPHGPNDFTQGLLFDNGLIYESTGLKRSSLLKAYELQTGKILKQHKVADKYFAEGLAMVGNKLIQLTYKSGKAFIYDKNSIKLTGEFNYHGEGWGLSYDGQHLIMSNGSSELSFLNPKSYNETKRLQVNDYKGPVTRLNELEYIDGMVYANIWGREKIAIINSSNGCIKAWLDLKGLTEYLGPYRRIEVLNGIAYNPKTKHLYVTGKWWPKLFEIKIIK